MHLLHASPTIQFQQYLALRAFLPVTFNCLKQQVIVQNNPEQQVQRNLKITKLPVIPTKVQVIYPTSSFFGPHNSGLRLEALHISML